MQINARTLQQHNDKITEAIQELKCVTAFLLGCGVSDKYSWKSQITNASELLQEYKDVLAELHLEYQEMTSHKYIIYIDSEYVEEIKYCNVDDSKSLNEDGKTNACHEAILLDIVTADTPDKAIQMMAAKYHISQKIIKAIPIK